MSYLAIKTNIIDSSTIFTGCDSKYWKQYGISFVKSFKHFNPTINIHVHLINPDEYDLESINNLPCNYSIEYIDYQFIQELSNNSLKYLENSNLDKDYSNNIKFGLKFCHEDSLEKNILYLITFSIYAMTRFIRLSEMWTGMYPVAAYDVDSICLKNINLNDMLLSNDAGCLRNKKGGCTASLVAFKNNSKFLKDWGNFLKNAVLEKKIYGFLDQDSFNEISKNYSLTTIDSKYCNSSSKGLKGLVITGKGQTKFSEIFLNEKKKWDFL